MKILERETRLVQSTHIANTPFLKVAVERVAGVETSWFETTVLPLAGSKDDSGQRSAAALVTNVSLVPSIIWSSLASRMYFSIGWSLDIP